MDEKSKSAEDSATGGQDNVKDSEQKSEELTFKQTFSSLGDEDSKEKKNDASFKNYQGGGIDIAGSSYSRTLSDSSSSGSEEENGKSFKIAQSQKEQKRQRVGTPTMIFPDISASPPKFVSLEQIMKAADGVSNMALAHEIAVDRDFKLEKVEPPENSLEKRVKDIVHKAFWDVFQSQLLEDPPNFAHAMILLEEVKQNLLALLLPHHTKLQQEINEVLDIELIQQQVEKGVLDFQYYAQYVISVMAKLCAPVRDEKIRELMKTTDVVLLFQDILQTLSMMKLDMANFTIQQIRPHIQQQSIDYEKQKFREFLETQDDGLEFTRQWLHRAVDKLAANTGAGKIISSAYLDILDWNTEHTFPETLLLDQTRFFDLQNQVEHITSVAAILLITYSIAGPVIQGISDFKEKLKKHIEILLTENDKNSPKEDIMKNIAVQINKDVEECYKKHGFTEFDVERQKILHGQIEELSSLDHRICKLLKTRILEFIEMVMTSSTASPIKIPPGLSAMQPELARLTGQFLRLVSHNKAVFGEYYSDILSSLRETCIKEPKNTNGSST